MARRVELELDDLVYIGSNLAQRYTIDGGSKPTSFVREYASHVTAASGAGTGLEARDLEQAIWNELARDKR